MNGSEVILSLLAGVALLLWAARMVRTGVERAFGQRLQRLVTLLGSSTTGSLTAGVAVAAAIQSSAAAGLLASRFIQSALLSVAAGIAFMLGADLGSTLVVQVLSLRFGLALPLLLIAGVTLFLGAQAALWRQAGRILIGFALIFISLRMMSEAGAALRGSHFLAEAVAGLTADPLLALLAGAAFTWLMHSTVASILFVSSLAMAGIIDMQLAGLLVVAANIGGGIIPLGLTWSMGHAVRRVMVANLGVRIICGVLVAALLPHILPMLTQWSADPARVIANLHTGINLTMVLVALPFIGLIARGLTHVIPDTHVRVLGRPEHLDEALLADPSVALAAATRSAMRLADSVEIMLRESLPAFSDIDGARRRQIRALDDEVDRIQEDIKLYLARLARTPLPDVEARRCFDLVMFTTNLEHVGDIIDKGLMALAAKKKRAGSDFSDGGWAEIRGLHERALTQLRLAITVFQTGDVSMARRLVEEKDRFRDAEAEAIRAHLERLKSGAEATVATSSLHLDVLRDLKRIVAHLTHVALPLLEAAGQIKATRLSD